MKVAMISVLLLYFIYTIVGFYFMFNGKSKGERSLGILSAVGGVIMGVLFLFVGKAPMPQQGGAVMQEGQLLLMGAMKDSRGEHFFYQGALELRSPQPQEDKIVHQKKIINHSGQ